MKKIATRMMMLITMEYRLADESSHALKASSHEDAIVALEGFPWDSQLASFINGSERVSPEVRFTRFTDGEQQQHVEAYAFFLRNEDRTWLIVAGATMPARFLNLFPITRKTDIIWDGASWQEVRDFIKRFYQSSRLDLFWWMKKKNRV